MPITLSRNGNTIVTSGLVDSGAGINVIPFSFGDQFGETWDQLSISVPLSGTLAGVPAKALALEARVASFAPVDLIFAWTRSENVPTLLGQINFFLAFDVCFFRKRLVFEVKPATP
jgi:hypothetical protein